MTINMTSLVRAIESVRKSKLVRAIDRVRQSESGRLKRLAGIVRSIRDRFLTTPNRSVARRNRMTFEGTVRLNAHTSKTYREFSGSAYNGGVFYPSVTVNGVADRAAWVLDLDSLTIPQPQRPVLDDHDESTDGVIGQTTMLAVRTSDYTLPVSGVLYTRKERSRKILDASDGGHKWQLSVGTDDFDIERVPVGKSVRVNNRTFHGPVSIARNARLTDLSFVAIGGDDTTYAIIAAHRSRPHALRHERSR